MHAFAREDAKMAEVYSRHPLEPNTKSDARKLVAIVLFALLVPPLVATLILLIAEVGDRNRIVVPDDRAIESAK
ncbi:hypothetical protein [Sandaracinus amylolyticus]|uniref:Uncharacterized protein n=1 Tax=Sandaracinus amylolyticus TaxID=927083 RepID=A0A0F6YLX9_9BACT|nr:hypothetical protein [Sandaracinus amylolyticus]AKF10720.1 hypothetical protein DB32_007869 [Sandaracinus amylolyticus]